MPHVNGFEYQPTKDLNRLIREYGIACLSDTTPPAPGGNTNVTWQTDNKGNISASVSAAGGGGVLPGTNLQLSAYTTSGTTVGPSGVTTDSTGQNLNVPGIANSVTQTTSNTFTQIHPLKVDIPMLATGAEYIQQFTNLNVQGPGLNFGNNGGWTTSLADLVQTNCQQRGIHQGRSSVINKHAVGDAASLYQYLITDGGIATNSDEGATGITTQVWESNGYFHGHVASTIGKGDINPTLALNSGNAWTTDGAFLLNITKGTISGNLNGASSTVSLMTNAGSVSPGLFSLPVTNTLPLSTAIGITTTLIPTSGGVANNPLPISVTVTTCRVGGTFNLFTVGSVVTIAGHQPEQAIVNSVVDNGNGTQTLTMNLRNPNPIGAVIFQGGIQGQYISFDANLAFSGMRSSYYALGSQTGTDLIYIVNVAGGQIGQTQIPQIGMEAATNTGASSGYHLYPGAEVVSNNNQGFLCTLEQNGVVWSNGDLVENPHYPVFGGSALFVNKIQTTPTNPSYGSAGALINVQGAGVNGGTNLLQLINNSPDTNFTSNGGPLGAPTAIRLQGQNTNLIYTFNTPSTSLIFIQNPAKIGVPAKFDIVTVNYTAQGHFSFDPSTSIWGVGGSFEASLGFKTRDHLALLVDGVSGTFTSSDSKTVTVTNGIITAIV